MVGVLDLAPRPGREHMTRLRFILAQLMATVVFIGIDSAALRSASLLWARL
jgi:hypothetical protein